MTIGSLLEELLKRTISGLLLFYLFRNMSVVILHREIVLSFIVVATLAVAFDWDILPLTGATIVSTILKYVI